MTNNKIITYEINFFRMEVYHKTVSGELFAIDNFDDVDGTVLLPARVSATFLLFCYTVMSVT